MAKDRPDVKDVIYNTITHNQLLELFPEESFEGFSLLPDYYKVVEIPKDATLDVYAKARVTAGLVATRSVHTLLRTKNNVVYKIIIQGV